MKIVVVHQSVPYVVEFDPRKTSVAQLKLLIAEITGLHAQTIKILGLEGGHLTDSTDLSTVSIKEFQKILILGDKTPPLSSSTASLAAAATPPLPLPSDRFTELPSELRYLIYGYLTANDLLHCARVCRAWLAVAQASVVWFSLFGHHWKLFHHALPVLDGGNWKTQYLRRRNIDNNARHGRALILGKIALGQVTAADIVWSPKIGKERRAGLLYVASDQKIAVVDLLTGEMSRALVGHRSRISAVAAIGHHVVSGDASGALSLWDLARARSSLPWATHSSELVNTITLTQNSGITVIRPSERDWLGVGRESGALGLFDLGAQRLAQTLYGHPAAICSMKISEATGEIVSGDGAGLVKFWDIASSKSSETIWASKEAVSHVMIEEAHTVVTGGPGGVWLWDRRLLKRGPALHIPNMTGQNFAFDGSRLWMPQNNGLGCAFIDRAHMTWEFIHERTPPAAESLTSLVYSLGASFVFADDATVVTCGPEVCMFDFDLPPLRQPAPTHPEVDLDDDEDVDVAL